MGAMKRPVRLLLVAATAVAFLPVGQVGAQRVDATRTVAPSALKRIGTISIPKLKVTQPIYSGVTNNVFDRGVGYWPGTALPGQEGNMVLGGHRTVGARPFYNIQKLAVGDPILVTRSGRTYTYVVNGTKIVKPTATWILDQTPTGTLTLFSCHPRGTARQRYVVTASLQA